MDVMFGAVAATLDYEVTTVKTTANVINKKTNKKQKPSGSLMK